MTVTNSAPGTPSSGPTQHEGVPLSDAIYAPGQGEEEGHETGLDLLAKLSLQLGDLSDSNGELADELARWRSERNAFPGWIDLNAVLIYSNVNPTALALSGGTGVGVLIGGPDIGRCWSVRNIVVGPVQVTGAAPSGSAYFCACSQPPADLSLTNAVDFSTALPNKAFYSPREFFIGPNDSLWMIIVNGTNGAQYVASCSIQDEPYRPLGMEITG